LGSGFTASTTVNADITVYARWTAAPGPYVVIFKLNNGTEANWADRTVTPPADTITGENFPAEPTRTGYSFIGWNTEPSGSGSAFTASTTVTEDMTVYARWTGGMITLNPDAGDGAFSQESFTLSKSGTGNPDSQTISVTGTGYTNPRWLVDRIPRGTGTDITLSAAHYSLGGHTLTLLITKDGVSWSKEISFTVTD
jgi:uncharacterized repeat protein (TIGR02543 family)